MNPTSTDGNCGANSDTNSTCLTSKFGNCCSSRGYCGSTSAYCGEGCQSLFGRCSTGSNQQTISTSGSCGSTSTSNITCLGSTFGDCCSLLGYCGGNSSYCGTGCQAGFGKCDSTASLSINSASTGSTSSTSTSTTTTSTSTSTPAPGNVSTDGNCSSGSLTHASCLGSIFGDCCSSSGFCGGNSSYCGAGCQTNYGSCDTSASSTGSSASPDSQALSGGAIAGISLGAAGAGSLIIALVVWLVFFKRKRSALYQETKPPDRGVVVTSEMDGRGKVVPVELPVVE